MYFSLKKTHVLRNVIFMFLPEHEEAWQSIYIGIVDLESQG